MKTTNEIIDEGSYYRAFKQWLDNSNRPYNEKNEDEMNEKWLDFASEIGIELGITMHERIFATVVDSISWKEARKYYSLITFKSYETNAEPIKG